MIAIAVAVLLMGQIRVGKTTMAAQFQERLIEAIRWGKKAAIPGTLVAKRSRGELNSLGDSEDDSSDSEEFDSDGEGVSSADQESILRLLQ